MYMSGDTIYNPETRRYVKKDGAIGKRIIKQYGYKEGYVFDVNKKVFVSPKQKATSPKLKPVVPISPKKPTQVSPKKKPADPTKPKKQSALPKPKKLSLVDTNITLSRLTRDNHEAAPRVVKPVGITVDRLEQLIKEDAFLKKLQQSIISLARHKVEVYKNAEMLPIHSSSTFYRDLVQLNNNFILTASRPGFIQELRTDLNSAINDRKLGMRSLIGRDKVMNKLASLIFAFSKNYRIFTRTFMNFAIFGSAGLGKSALAKVIAFVFKKAHILTKGTVTVATRQELVGSFIGQTAGKTRDLLFQALEGILFIDEAYSLTPCPDGAAGPMKDFGPEAVAELINFMDKTIGLMVIMVAGYEDKMIKCFFTSNEGLDRRFPNKLTIQQYTAEELTQILLYNLQESEVDVDTRIANFMYSVLNKIYTEAPEVFYNQAGDMLNLGSTIVQTIYMSDGYNWNDDFESSKIIFLSAMEEFLANKGYAMSFA